MRCPNARSILNPKKVMTSEDAPYVVITCNKKTCLACQNRNKMQWCNRLMEHGRDYLNKFFITLTYNELNLPLLNLRTKAVKTLQDMFDDPWYKSHEDLDKAEYYPTLSKKEMVLWIRRLRKKMPFKLNYWLCGEYGPEKCRPHYHLLLFIDAPKDIIITHDDMVSFIQETWTNGFPSVEPVNDRDIRYTCKYSLKQVLPDDFPAVKPFMLCSNGIGKAYTEKESVRRFYGDNIDRFYYPLNNGGKSLMPRYWKERLFSDATRARYAKEMAKKSGIPSSVLEYRSLKYFERVALNEQIEKEREQYDYELKLATEALRRNNIPTKIPIKLI